MPVNLFISFAQEDREQVESVRALARNPESQIKRRGRWFEKTLALFKKHNARVLFGTDCAFDMREVQHLEFKYRSQFFSSLDILRQATSNGGQALRMSGKLYPYPGDLGVIKEGAMADVLIVKDNPLDDVTILSDYDEQLLFIMKDGKTYKNII